jgi:hypothetical protein
VQVIARDGSFLGVREYSARTGRLLRVLDRRSFTQLDGTPGNVLWISSNGASMVAMLPPPRGSGQRAGGGAPVLGVLTGNQFTPMPFASPRTAEFAW